ncbi:TPA: BMP family protein [Streptococcus agalactiae]|nr:BMP family protein [Streptococcus agalactiae]
MNKKIAGIGLASIAVLSLAACGHRGASKSGGKSDSLKVAMVTDTGGVDDKSFNQSGWEGMQAWGKKNGLKKGAGFDYFQSASESDYATNLDTAVSSGYKLIFGIGFSLHDAIDKAADNNKDVNYVIVDDVIKGKDNVASVVFADNESAYLAGIAAAKTTKTKTVGFVGGMESEVITRFEKGFEAGVFSEAKSRNESLKEADKVWVLGVDRDQAAEGKYTSKDGKASNFVLASSIKEVGKSVELIATKTSKGKFPGGNVTTYGLKDGGVDIATTNLSDDAVKAIKEAKAKIISGDIKVPSK